MSADRAVDVDVDLVEAIARRVAEVLRPERPLASWLTADEVARMLAVDPGYVYEHAAALGGRRLGTGPKARLRFRLEDVEGALPCVPSRGPGERVTTGTKPKQQRRATARLGTEAPLLPIRGES